MASIGRFLNIRSFWPALSLLCGLGLTAQGSAFAGTLPPAGASKPVISARADCTTLEKVELSAAKLYVGTTSLNLFFADAVFADAKNPTGFIGMQAGKGTAELHFQGKANALYVVTVFSKEGAPMNYTLTTVGVVSKGTTQAATKGVALIPVSTADAGDILLDITGDTDNAWPLYKIDIIQVQ